MRRRFGRHRSAYGGIFSSSIIPFSGEKPPESAGFRKETMKQYAALLPSGIWPPALTAFTPGGVLDMPGNRALFEWYAAVHVDGLFVSCLTGELNCLSSREVVELNRLAVETSAGRYPVVGGVMAAVATPEAIAEEVLRLAETGVAAVVVLVSQLASPDEDDDRLLANTRRLLDRTGDVPLGLYECPKPYHRLLKESTLAELAATGRFLFFKDTCCDIRRIRERIRLVRGTPLRLFNANAATLLDSFRAGVNGYCGVGANYYPKLFQLLWHHCESSGAEELGRFIAANDHLADLGNAYPVSAKFMAQLHGLPVSLCCRITDRTIDDADRLSLRKLDSDAGLLIRNFSAVPSMETA